MVQKLVPNPLVTPYSLVVQLAVVRFAVCCKVKLLVAASGQRILEKYSANMKAELLDIDAILSHATAELSMPNPDLATVRAKVDEARDMILDLAEGLEGVEGTAKN
jgi:hypothetical protein